ncbi:MAG: dTDP-4-dehydrorhamnose reductase [Bacteroidetes bacterium GWA2_32_17]|nr:MAG: dTDP-4-dehydrorhamnose reductase [Bacteroidetes bacterium GWA2_32_17]
MANILVTGSNGQLGNEIRELRKEFNHFNFILTDVNELDITNVPMLKQFFNNNKVNYIINCAAYTAVDKAESDYKNADKINVTAVSNLVKLAANYKIKFFHISTDYVFDGASKTPYTEISQTNPKSVYGLTKLKGEIEASRYIQTVVFRTSWLYSSYGNNFVKTMLKLGSVREEINVVNDQIGCPTYANDLARVILNIISTVDEKNNCFKPGIYNYSNEGSCSWCDFATEIMKLANLKCKVNPVETKDYPTPAKRPKYSVLNKNKIVETYNIEIPPWQDSLEKCINKINKQLIK